MTVLNFVLPPELEAHEPPEARGLARDQVRLLVAERATGAIAHRRFTDLPELLRPGDVLVVNTSGTLAAAVPIVDSRLTVHFSTELADGGWLVELRAAHGKATAPFPGGVAGQSYPLLGGGVVTLRERYSRERLWLADVVVPGGSVLDYLAAFGSPIRYGYVPKSWPISAYQTVFATEPGSAEMPSASRPFTDRLVTRLVAAGVQFAPVLLHTGVASPEAHERPYPERFAVSATTARIVNQARAAGGRVIAVGTTAVRALESAADERSAVDEPGAVDERGVVDDRRAVDQRGAGDDKRAVAAREGWTELIVTPERGVRVVDGLLTGFHEPAASHLDMLAAVTDRATLSRAYTEAIDHGYLWHEFGDVNLLLP